MYKVLRPILFLFDPEKIHHFTFSFLRFTGKIPGVRNVLRLFFHFKNPKLATTLMGLKFRNKVGLAAGFDKDAKLIDELACFGFGFIEIGTLTPLAQPGNDRPRLFRLPLDQALINRMGFNNGGVASAVARLKNKRADIIVGGNIGKNKLTPNEDAVADYRACVDALHPWVDYFVVNVSSPNTPGLRSLQEKEPLKKIMTEVKMLAMSKPVARPVMLKIAPDLTDSQLDDIIEILKDTGTDGVIATNTTISRAQLNSPAHSIAAIGAGGLSGKPLKNRSLEVIAYLRNGLGAAYPIIGVGGIMSANDAESFIRAGANLVQIYTGFIYEGPGIVKAINRRFASIN